MATWAAVDRFHRDLNRLPPELRLRFNQAIKPFSQAIDNGAPFPPGLRIKGVQGQKGVFEMAFAPDGRATFEFGQELTRGVPHVIWRRVGTHKIFDRP